MGVSLIWWGLPSSCHTILGATNFACHRRLVRPCHGARVVKVRTARSDPPFNRGNQPVTRSVSEGYLPRRSSKPGVYDASFLPFLANGPGDGPSLTLRVTMGIPPHMQRRIDYDRARGRRGLDILASPRGAWWRQKADHLEWFSLA